MRFQCNNCMSVVAIEDSEMGQPVACGNCSKVVVVPSTRLGSGAVLGDFVIERHLGAGGLASVYLAHQLSLDRPAAIKILHDKFARDAAFIKNFIHEARAAAQLNHPNIVQAYAVGEEDGIYYFAMEYVQGNTLKSVLSHSGRFVVDQALRIAQEIGTALDFAWNNKQLVHRDIKPDNIIVTENRVVKLADLGLARVREDILNDHSEEIFGTPQYVAPEQLLGYPADNRSDIYSLGATLFHLVTGECPYVGKTPAETARKHITDVLPSPRDLVPDIPEPVCQLIRVMMAKRPGHRYQSAAEFLDDLALVHQGEDPNRCSLKAFETPIDLEDAEQEMAAEITEEQMAEIAALQKRRSLSRQAHNWRSRGGSAVSTNSSVRLKKIAGNDDKPAAAQSRRVGGSRAVSYRRSQAPAQGGDEGVGKDKTEDGGTAGATKSRRNLKLSASGSRRAAASERMVRKSRVGGAARENSGKGSGGSKLKVFLILLALAVVAGSGFGYYWRFYMAQPAIEPRFGLTAARTGRLHEIEDAVETEPRASALAALRAGLAEFDDSREAVEHLRQLAAPLLEEEAREKRAAQRSQELDRWRELSRELAEQEQQRLQREAEEAARRAAEAEAAAEAARAAELREQRLQRLREQRDRLRRETIPLARRHRFAQARIDYAAMTASQETEFRDWARDRVEMLELAEKALATFRNTGTELTGMRFVAPGQIRPGQIVSIDNLLISAEIVDPVYEAGQLVGERRIPLTVPIDSLELRRLVGLIDSAWLHRGGTDEAERDLMVGAYLLARGEMLEEARRRLQNARGRIAQSLLGEIDSVREAARSLD